MDHGLTSGSYGPICREPDSQEKNNEGAHAETWRGWMVRGRGEVRERKEEKRCRRVILSTLARHARATPVSSEAFELRLAGVTIT